MRRNLSLLLALPLAASFYVAGCLSDSDSAPPVGLGGSGGSSGSGGSGGTGVAADPSANEASKDADPKYVAYRDLASHPGCTKEGLDSRKAIDATDASYAPADIPGFNCAAKLYPTPSEDLNKPIVVLVHGNSSTPRDYESFLYPGAAGPAVPQLAERLTAEGFRVYAADFRYDRVDDPADMTTGNPAKNFDHGWAVPILQSMVGSLMQQFPARRFSLVGFSLGTTIIRDTMRRMHREKLEPFARVKDLVLIAGANHGVSSFVGFCGDVNSPRNNTMRGGAACQLGDRDTYQPVPFLVPLNGPDGVYETPCADGDTAWGQSGVCGGNAVQYTTLVKEDPAGGPLQDEFVSERSAALNGAQNLTVAAKDSTRFFLGINPMQSMTDFALFDDHYGALRSPEALDLIVTALSD